MTVLSAIGLNTSGGGNSAGKMRAKIVNARIHHHTLRVSAGTAERWTVEWGSYKLNLPHVAV